MHQSVFVVGQQKSHPVRNEKGLLGRLVMCGVTGVVWCYVVFTVQSTLTDKQVVV